MAERLDKTGLAYLWGKIKSQFTKTDLDAKAYAGIQSDNMTAIVANTDLNTLTTFGTYYCARNDIAETLTNSPTTNAFRMQVIDIIHQPAKYIRQEVIEYTNGYYCRYSNNGGSSWFKWQQYNIVKEVQEWGNANFTYSDGFAAYNTTANNKDEPRASKFGRIVNLTGAFKSTAARDSTNTVTIGRVPSGCEPLYFVCLRQQSSGQNTFMLTIDTSGRLQASRYGVATNTIIPNNCWLNIDAMYISKE